MRGRSSHRTPGFRKRRGPIQVSGLARSDQIGSVRILIPLCWSSSVEWLTSVIRSSLHARRRFRWLNVRNEAGGWFGPAG